jgi:hypothetical protein
MTVPENVAREFLEALRREAPELGQELEQRMASQSIQDWFRWLEELEETGRLPESARERMTDLFYSLR